MRKWSFLLKTLRIWPWWLAPLGVSITLLITLGFWIGSKIAYADWFENPWLYFSKTCALSAVTLMGWLLLLTTRALWTERLCGGLDKVYTLHRYIGKVVFFLLCLHPFFLSISRISSWNEWLLFFILPYPFPDNTYQQGANIGALSWIILVILIFFSFNFLNPYRRWLSWHKGMGFFYLISMLHIVLVEKDIASYPFLFSWIWSWLLFGFFSWCWTKLYPWIGPKSEYSVDHIEVTREIVVLKIRALNDKLIFKPGQWVFLEIPSLGSERHPFSIASIPNEKGKLVFGIRILGPWTKQLQEVKKGEEVIVYGPYGMLSDHFLGSSRDCVCIGAGVGITPFIGMWALALETFDRDENKFESCSLYNSWEEMIAKWKSPKLDLFYLVNSEKEAVFDPMIQQIGISTQFIHRRTPTERGHFYHLLVSNPKKYVTLSDIASLTENLHRKNILICGPVSLIKSFKKQAQEFGISHNQIFFEAFDWRNGPID